MHGWYGGLLRKSTAVAAENICFWRARTGQKRCKEIRHLQPGGERGLWRIAVQPGAQYPHQALGPLQSKHRIVRWRAGRPFYKHLRQRTDLLGQYLWTSSVKLLRPMLLRVPIPDQHAVLNLHRPFIPRIVLKPVLIRQTAQGAWMVVDAHYPLSKT